MKITAEITCGQCRKVIQIKGTPFRTRRSGGIQFRTLFTVESGALGPTLGSDSNEILIRKGYTYFIGDDAEEVICSALCVQKRVAELLPKLRPSKDGE